MLSYKYDFNLLPKVDFQEVLEKMQNENTFSWLYVPICLDCFLFEVSLCGKCAAVYNKYTSGHWLDALT